MFELNIEPPLATIKLNRAEKLNAVNRKLMGQLRELLADLKSDSRVRLVILTGTGDKAFCSGVQLDELVNFENTDDARDYALELDDLFNAFFQFPKPVIAAINGLALGGGFALAQACDLRVATDTAKFGFPAVRIGAILPIGCTLQMVEQIGLGRTKDLLLTGRLITAEQAHASGLVEHICTSSELDSVCHKLANDILEGADKALTFTKQVTNHLVQVEIERYRQSNADNFAFLSTTDDWKKRITAFLNRKAN